MARKTRKANLVSPQSGGGAQLVHASTGPAAQLVQAHTTTGGGVTSAPLVNAPTPQISRQQPILHGPMHVGGEKQHHQGYATQTPTVGGVDLILKKMGDGSFKLVDANGNVRKTYTQGQMEFVRKRGNAGATMDPLDSAAFSRFSGVQSETEKAEKLHQRVRQEKADDEAAAAKRNADEFDRRQGIVREVKAEERKLDEASRLAAEKRANAEYGRREAEKIRREKLDAAAKGIKAGTHEYTKDQKSKMDDMQGEIDRIMADDTMTPEAREKSVSTLRGKIEDIRMNPHEKIVPKMTLGEDFAQNTYKDDNGRIWTKGKEGWKLSYNPKDYERGNEAQRREDELKYKEQQRKDAWLDARISTLMKDRKEYDKNAMEEVTIPGLGYQAAYDQAMGEMKIRFPEPTPAPTPEPAPAPTQAEPVTNPQENPDAGLTQEGEIADEKAEEDPFASKWGQYAM